MTEDQIRRLLAEMKHDIERVFHREILEQNKVLERIEREVVATNGRVTRLEQKAIAAEAVATDRALQAKSAAELVAAKAAKAISDRERSRRWWLGLAAAITTGVGAAATLGSFIAQYLHHI